MDYSGLAVLNYLREHTGETILLNQIAESTGLHINTIMRKFKKYRAEGVIKVVGNKRYEVIEN